ncbi:MAG: hypothetical protein BLITH_0103 [Brockia lithotrophica]|uniref:Secreted protein n=1 Tax=Brockia lithotrophica TaxID=933949 RepID=A0A2T5G513_9BACL|nr:hypothetical protein [Brockia lithotrophica]PTQ51277.1 MAG: hypothetical protein BLITH_0103 [Brockia lithotrophica]
MKVRVGVVTAVLALVLFAGGGLAFAQGNALGDLLTAVGQLVGDHDLGAVSYVEATTPNAVLTAQATYGNKQTGLNGLVGGLLGGSYSTAAEIKGPNNLSAGAYTNGDYGLASTVRGLSAGLAGLLSGVLGK